MAGTGMAPKFAENRRNGHAPQRGEWTMLYPLTESALPDLPEGCWSVRTLNAWEAWRADPATGVYGPAEKQLALDLAYTYERWVQEATAALAAEVRQRVDGLGLSPKGKQDRRWRVASGSPKSSVATAAGNADEDEFDNVVQLRAVDPALAAE